MKTFKDQLMEWQKITEKKKKFTTSTNPKKLSDDDLIDFYSWLDNMPEPNPDNKDQHKKVMKDCEKEMKKRGYKGK